MKQGIGNKEIANVAVDKRRNRDLDALKAMGGPFTSCKQVDIYLRDMTINETAKNNRFFLEVRYARDTALSVPKYSDILGLKKDYKNLPSNIYATNLKIYLGNVTAKTTVTFGDFSQALILMDT
ncbi:hypothetical protein SNE40_019121 [Patella caerulea]|uniref:Uncharacterized protein n=1 Tax=Patella caerulea TaxID=87958 RepID=A0AAN8P930_PATCE